MKSSVQKMLNVSEDLPDSFWESKEAMDKLKAAINGDEKALRDLQAIAAKLTLEDAANNAAKIGIDVDQTSLDEAKAAIDILANSDVGVGVTLNNDSFLDTLYDTLV
uniref:Uncharacterized protein n=1 Tax=Siphoviridae sp. ct2vX3 TaxID=2825318 RepID=A0A8S5PZ58_9CAUD|nr:MAG TPA: hypothetical protein [Siphoviridae sp. ct2vX3]